MTYTDFNYYTNKFYGNVIPSSLYNKYELEARTKVDMLTLRRIKEMNDSIKKGVCAVADYLYVKNGDEVNEMELIEILMPYIDINLITRAI